MEAGSGAGDQSAPEAHRFLVESRPGAPGVVVLSLSGELDHDTAQPLQDALEEHDTAGRVVVDCAGLRFCDSTGLNVLLRARLRLRDTGGHLDLAGLGPPVDRMFEITGARTVFRVYDDVADALADRRPG
ncbi:STAS domain-containing protein [Streptomyces sp. NBC_01216]|uniref:STAS domain-containing protein n=1 Tax=Streptomyces sp. NBC_01216 TaxID=2903778 RepID=UPI002E15C9E0|nr:STAS domain-containing protein [Streptomyces sp. NBC_01216]